MRENGKMIKLMALEDISTLMALSTKETGRKINSTDMEKKLGLMELVMKVITKTERRTERVNLCGLMVQHMMDSL